METGTIGIVVFVVLFGAAALWHLRRVRKVDQVELIGVVQGWAVDLVTDDRGQRHLAVTTIIVNARGGSMEVRAFLRPDEAARLRDLLELAARPR